MVEAVERGDPGERRWYVRVTGESKDVFTDLVHPGPADAPVRDLRDAGARGERAPRFYEHLLRRNRKLNGAAFGIGEEDGDLPGRVSLPVHAVDEGELDRILGSLYSYVEQFFLPALRIGFASRFGDRLT